MTLKKMHPVEPDSSFDGGDLHCGNGLLLLIRKHIDPLERGQVLEILASDPTVHEELSSWCRLTENELVSVLQLDDKKSYLVCKGKFDQTLTGKKSKNDPSILKVQFSEVKTPVIPASLARLSEAPAIGNLAVTGIGSWPRPAWMLRTLNEYLEGKIDRQQFDDTADDAAKLAIAAQLEAKVDVITDGEQRRDNYASFVGSLLDNCQLIPLTDLLPLVDDPDKFKSDLDSLDVPADKVRHPVVFGPLGRSTPLAGRDVDILHKLTDKPIKIALPGPYLLTRIMWMDCIVNKVYEDREALSQDIVRVLKEELHYLLSRGVSVVQFDEPVLSEVVFSGPKNKRSFMCGALSESKSPEHELSFAVDLINSVVDKVAPERTGVHICRGNWTADQSVALSGSYEALLPVLKNVKVGHLFLEYCTERAGGLEWLSSIPEEMRVGVGLVNPKDKIIESVDDIAGRAKLALNLLGKNRLILTPDCGFATFADNPVASAEIASGKLANLVTVAARLKE